MDLAKGDQRYIEEFPTDGPSWTAAFKVLESYSGIPKDQIEAHVREIVSPSLQSVILSTN